MTSSLHLFVTGFEIEDRIMCNANLSLFAPWYATAFYLHVEVIPLVEIFLEAAASGQCSCPWHASHDLPEQSPKSRPAGQ